MGVYGSITIYGSPLRRQVMQRCSVESCTEPCRSGAPGVTMENTAFSVSGLDGDLGADFSMELPSLEVQLGRTESSFQVTTNYSTRQLLLFSCEPLSPEAMLQLIRRARQLMLLLLPKRRDVVPVQRIHCSA